MRLAGDGLTAVAIAAAVGRSPLTVRRWPVSPTVASSRIWQAHGLKSHLVETFEVSRDKNFTAKVADIVGLYLNPPDNALVVCVDENSQIRRCPEDGGNDTYYMR